MRVVRPLLAMKIDRGIAGIVRCPVLFTLALKALQTGPSFDQCAVHGEVFIAGQVLFLRLFYYLAQKLACHIAIEQTIPILGKHGDVPHGLIQIHANKPAEQQAIIDLFHQQSFATYRVQHLDQLCPEQLLRRDRRAARICVHPIKSIRHTVERLIGHRANSSQRMVLPHPLFGRKVAEHVGLLMILAAHTT
jgi:hypothetical protein